MSSLPLPITSPLIIRNKVIPETFELAKNSSNGIYMDSDKPPLYSVKIPIWVKS